MRKALTVLAMVAMGFMGVQTTANAEAVQITSPLVLEWMDQCKDGTPVYMDDETGLIYGDQDDNGILDGTDCDWS